MFGNWKKDSYFCDRLRFESNPHLNFMSNLYIIVIVLVVLVLDMRTGKA